MVVLGYLPKLKRGLGLKAMADRGRGGGAVERGRQKYKNLSILRTKRAFR